MRRAWSAQLRARVAAQLGKQNQNGGVRGQFERRMCGARALMNKLILLSILIGMIALPARAANEANPRQGLRRLIIWMVIFEACYVFALNFLFNRF